MTNFKDITVENMTVEDAREWLGSWLLHSAISSQHRGMGEEEKRLGDLCSQAYKLLGDDEYTKIYNKSKEAHT